MGKNPDVFYYQFLDVDEYGLLTLKLCFYGAIEVYGTFAPKDFQLPGDIHLIDALIKDGMKVIIEENNKSYTFN